MTIPFVDLKAQYLSIKDEIDGAIATILDETSFISGPAVKAFESQFERLYGVKHCIGVANGTDAIYITLKMIGIKPGDEVITSATSWISTSETITQAGARPIFVDIHPDTFTIDPDLIEAHITPQTKAIIPVHLYGQAAHVTEIRRICEKRNLFLIEDCAQAHFSAEYGNLTGTFGAASTFSFYPGKNLGAYGDAGAILTNDSDLAAKVRMYANHGALKKHEHLIEGVNSRLDSIQAAILSVKAQYIMEWTNLRISNAEIYREALQDIREIINPVPRKDTRHSFHLYVIRTKRRNELKEYLEKNGVQTAIHYPKALPNLTAYQYLGHKKEDFPIATKYQDEILSLPMYPELTKEQIEYVAARIKLFFKG